jgi:ATP-dependent exoDNAse (exonuclease V) alpha subunit
MNGDIGVIIDVSLKYKTLLIEFDDKSEEYHLSTSAYGGEYSFHGDGSDNMTTDMLDLAHCITIHKCQGSEWQHVIVYIPFGPKNVDFFNFYMLWTAITRSIFSLRIIGDIVDFQTYLKKIPDERIDHLAKYLQQYVEAELD